MAVLLAEFGARASERAWRGSKKKKLHRSPKTKNLPPTPKTKKF
jgi:hypothetical protein